MVGKKEKKERKEKEDNEKTYNVDAILDVDDSAPGKVPGIEPFFHVKWTGFNEDQNTWEPYENVKGCLPTFANYKEIMAKANAIWARLGGRGNKRLSNASTGSGKRSRSSKLTPPVKRFKGINNSGGGSGKRRRIESSSESDDTDEEEKDDYRPRQVDESRCAVLPPPPLERPTTSSSSSKQASVIDFDEIERMQFDKTLVPDYIMGVIPNRETNKLYFVIKWKNPHKESVQIVYNKFANKHYPQTVIEFYESKLKFEN